MLRFFRQIRQRLLTENKVSRYLLYAIGEILLVVIGILIALWVNDWNEDRKGSAKRNALLTALAVEFNNNLIQLDSVISYNDSVLEATDTFIRLRPEQLPSTPKDTLRKWLRNTTWLWTFDPQNGALRSGISSGDIHLIQSDSLINLLFSWPDVVADAGENEDRHIALRMKSNEIVSPYIRLLDIYGIFYPELDKDNLQSDYQGLVKDYLFQDYAVQLYGHTVDAQNELKLVRRQNLSILELISQELNRSE
ncbi:DUF6090 family protein [Robiginitalea sp. IMCC44478]|uniref:DUF6090 family protein n=1 Tax=Robiginitalea sp. IMCC44478 TaxID=3459122 RepID=UPI0040435EAA